MHPAGTTFRKELGVLMEALAISPGDWYPNVATLFEHELSHPIKVQLRLDASFLAVVARSHLASVRSRLYRVLGDEFLDFQVASACENVSKRFPEAAWLVKLSLSGQGPHAKLALDRRLDLTELEGVLECLKVPVDKGISATAALLDSVGVDTVRRVSASPGRPIRVEVYAEHEAEPGGGASVIEALAAQTGLEGDSALAALREHHQTMCRYGQQRYTIGFDENGLRNGLKIEYADVPAADLGVLIDALIPAPTMARRRLQVVGRTLALKVLDHVSVRLRSELPVHMTAYFNRSYAAVA